jgi:acetoin utilization deacetylase AcuC-like enzyme
MITVYSDDHRLHHGAAELSDGHLQPHVEMPSRADLVLEQVRAVALGDVVAPSDFGLEPLLCVHTEPYVHFLQSIWDRWKSEGRNYDILPMTWPVRTLRSDRIPTAIDGLVSYYSFDAGTPITAGTWTAARSAANVALTAAQHITSGKRSAFALCRPPGHHATADLLGGYCYLNNAAIAAQYLRDNGSNKVGILDVDYHHGNGTQTIFWERSDVPFVSIHADPDVEYPYFLGYADETGTGTGTGANLNIPLPWGTAWTDYQAALQLGCDTLMGHGVDALVVSLGVDTFEHDPISKFKLVHDDYLRLGARIAAMGLPTLFVFEGGYAIDAIGINAVNVLTGFEEG